MFIVIGSHETAVLVNGVEAEELLENIAIDLRQLLPMEAQLSNETIVFPKIGKVFRKKYVKRNIHTYHFFL